MFDISDATAPRLLSSWSPTTLGRTFGVAINSNHAFLAAGRSGLYFLDIARLYPRLAPQIRFTAAGPHVLFQGEPGQALHLQRSADLKNWEDWQTTNASGDWQEAVDAQAGSQPTRFYRIVVP